MFNYLLLLQYPLLYLPMALIGLGIYGSDFDGVAGGLYVLAILVAPLIAHWARSWIFRLNRLQVITAAIVGVFSGFWLYRTLHFAVWDEHAWFQAALVMVLGIISSVLSMRAAGKISAWHGDHRRTLLLGLLLVALAWLPALAFPFMPFLAVALLALWKVYLGEFSTMSRLKSAPHAYGFNAYSLFLAVFLMFLPVWDYRVDTHWALLLAIGFLFAAVGSLVVRNGASKLRLILTAVLIIDFVAVIIWPVFTIYSGQAAITGLLVGYALGNILRDSRAALPEILMPGLVQPWAFGMLLGFMFYTNYAHTQWRMILLLPLILLIFREWRSAQELAKPAA